MDFECHITVKASDAKIAQEAADNFGWKTSEIARDPLLGDATFFYCTRHSSNYIDLFHWMCFLTNRLQEFGVAVLRQKIELIMLDTKKSGVINVS